MVEQELRDKYEVVIGLEVHAQLKTNTKIFAPDPKIPSWIEILEEILKPRKY